ncbi:ISAzo13 family transposase [Acidithiobacillus thiooxidans]|uniref:ISAzo13 family transposase n=1 Tax=Acidithiobacillus thiooxidans TaxID=930 RepID=UPI00285CAD2D|nr:ISAzo13 family transposase [Acidithiobacillus thiooxidans]MDR7925925.1 ISAzo13 family transposase [Acidithiobacillus thiooxidans]MDR7926087.1 ISAzo13 family transposase [Acidithiobacillus thiooxidans]MDR7926885.1 ISAzo13 family transposase [Acidithiobacillus thiooxidans]MDR7928483.1 ISAzo13 family transposase [Acidithiobacillus thiooxidans]
MEADALIAARHQALEGILDERQRRLYAAVEAKVLGHGGVKRVSEATGVARGSIMAGLKELKDPENRLPQGRVRRSGGGRKRLVDRDPDLLAALEGLVDPAARGDPQSPLRWTCKSLKQLARELGEQGHRISHVSVGILLKELGYSLQGNRKTLEGTDHPDRDAQFRYIQEKTQQALDAVQPVISVDTKKKELVGNYKNAGQEWRPQGEPEVVQVHDFVDKEMGRANPYGVYDLAQNAGWVSVGTDHDTASFAVATIRRWWLGMGQPLYPDAKELMITADGGGSNGSRVRLWKLELQGLADELNLPIRVCHFPPGTSKWNKIEHRLFSYISMNWRGRPLVSHEVIVNLIAATTTSKGLKVYAAIDPTPYPKGIKVTDAEFATIQIDRDNFHGEWNYVISPNKKSM